VVTGIEYGCDAFFTFEKDVKGLYKVSAL